MNRTSEEAELPVDEMLWRDEDVVACCTEADVQVLPVVLAVN